jgi:H+-translocating NAD(P) transhydrogenase
LIFVCPQVRIRYPSGYSDLPSRLPTQSSTLYSNNITKFLLSITPPNTPSSFHINLEDEVVRGALVVHRGALLEPVPRAAPAPPPTPSTPSKVAEAEKEARAITPWQKVTREVAIVTAGMGTTVALGKVTGPLFMTNFFTFGLAGLIGYRVVWGVAPALHSPLMSVTNAISGKCSLVTVSAGPRAYSVTSGMVGIGGLFVMGGGYFPGTTSQALGALSVLLASVNVAGGFVITKRMLDMFKSNDRFPAVSDFYTNRSL